MDSKKLVFITIIISLVVAVSSLTNYLQAQQPPCMQDYYGLTFQVDELEESPPLSIYMPFDVILGYIALDTISKNSSEEEFKNFLNSQTYNDTIKYIMKHFYQMVDYDPILYLQTKYHIDNYSLSPRTIETEILKTIEKVSDNTFTDIALCKSSIIAHVRVTDTLRRMTPSAGYFKTSAIVTCEILDTIKGKIIPECKDVSLSFPIVDSENKDGREKILDFPENCLQFEYRLEWPLGKWDNPLRIAKDSTGKIVSPRLVDSNDVPWVKKDVEYIVFLRTGILCGDSLNIYYILGPRLHNSKTCGMYPIIDNTVFDPDDEFGFGTGLTPSEFKSALRSKISDIINYENE